jgi:hypothetical protein
MPTKAQIESVAVRIESLKSMNFNIEDGDIPEPSSDISLPSWGSLSQAQRKTVLDMDVNWIGFTEAQEDDIIRSVIDDDAPELWMDGIEPDDYWERLDDTFRFEGETPAAIFAEVMEDFALRRMPEDPSNVKPYDQQLQDAIDSGRFRNQNTEREPER